MTLHTGLDCSEKHLCLTTQYTSIERKMYLYLYQTYTSRFGSNFAHHYHCVILGIQYVKCVGNDVKVNVKPIFHWKWGSRWLPNGNEIYKKKIKCTWPTPEFCVGTPRGWRQLKQNFALGNAKFWRWVHCPTLTPGILRSGGI